MNLFTLLARSKPDVEEPASFVREVRDIRGVRVLRLQGPVGKEIGAQVTAMDAEVAHSEGGFAHPMLLDFKDTSDCDFSTVSYLVQAISRRMISGAPVGIINASRQLLAEFQIAKLTALFHVYPSEEAALQALAPTGGKK